MDQNVRFPRKPSKVNVLSRDLGEAGYKPSQSGNALKQDSHCMKK